MAVANAELKKGILQKESKPSRAQVAHARGWDASCFRGIKVSLRDQHYSTFVECSLLMAGFPAGLVFITCRCIQRSEPSELTRVYDRKENPKGGKLHAEALTLVRSGR